MVAVYHGDLYKILLVSQTAASAEIKTSYRKLAIKFHPDKSKDDGEKFKEISHAYGVLSDPEQRARYDLTYRPGGTSSTFDSFNSWYNGFNGFNNQGGSQSTSHPQSRAKATPRKPRKQPEPKKPFEGYTKPCAPTEKIIYDFRERETYRINAESSATLRQVFNGSTIEVKYTETLSCPKCLNGVKKTIQTRNCETCKGHGALDKKHGKSPITKCPKCNGSGREDATLTCKRCNGTPQLEERTIELTLKRGLVPTQIIEVNNKGNLMHDGLRGDITFTVHIDLHDEVFTLIAPDKLDLRCTVTLSLEEALLGFENRRLCTHMDGKVLVSTQPPGRVVKPDTVRQIRGEGMPDPNDPDKRGNLEILFKVEFPDEIYPTDHSVRAARQIFSPRPPTPPPPPVINSPPPVMTPSPSSPDLVPEQPEESTYTTTSENHNPASTDDIPTHTPPKSSQQEDSYQYSPEVPAPPHSYGRFIKPFARIKRVSTPLNSQDDFENPFIGIRIKKREPDGFVNPFNPFRRTEEKYFSRKPSHNSDSSDAASRKRSHDFDSPDAAFFIPKRKARYNKDQEASQDSFSFSNSSGSSQKKPDVIVIEDDEEDVVDMTNKLRSMNFHKKKL